MLIRPESPADISAIHDLTQAAFAPKAFSDAASDWCGLGPISVRADHQGRGIGRALIEAGISALADQGAAGCVLTGNPNIYQHMDFQSDGNLHHAGTQDRHVHWRVIKGGVPKGQLHFAPALDDA